SCTRAPGFLARSKRQHAGRSAGSRVAAGERARPTRTGPLKAGADSREMPGPGRSAVCERSRGTRSGVFTLRTSALLASLVRCLSLGVPSAASAGRPGRFTGELPAVGAPEAPAAAEARQERAQADGREEGAAGWRKFADNPVLGGDLGTCFDVSLLREGQT